MLKYRYDYHQSFVYKIFCASKSGETPTTFEEALEIIKGIYNMSLGMKLIVYLVGWQHEGHDSKYPDWREFNERLKRNCDKTTRDSFLWLCQQAKAYNCVVSVHVNMCDAYENSPLWHEYSEKDLLVRENDGSLRKGSLWGGEQAYLVSKTREWQSGYAQKRLDELIELLLLEEAGTLHIDVFEPYDNPYHGITHEDDFESMKKIVSYLNLRGIDVTKEWFHAELLGMIPMVYHLNFDEAQRLAYPPDVICGGGSMWNLRRLDRAKVPPWQGFFIRPSSGCLYDRAWGESFDYDLHMNQKDVDWIENETEGFRSNFYLKTIPWYYLNRLNIIRHTHSSEQYSVEFDGGHISTIDISNGRYSLYNQDRIFVDGDNIFMPALWSETNQWIMYSHVGGLQEWNAPKGWTEFEIYLPDKDGEKFIGQVDVINGKIKLRLEPRQSMVLRQKT